MDAKPQEVRVKEVAPAQELEDRADEGGEIIVARRKFPSETYNWKYQKATVIMVRAKLSLQGRESEIKTVMTSKESKLVLVVPPPRIEEEVSGEVVPR